MRLWLLLVGLLITTGGCLACDDSQGLIHLPDGSHAPAPTGQTSDYVPPRVVVARYLQQFQQAEVEFPPVSFTAVNGKIQSMTAWHSGETLGWQELCVESFWDIMLEWCEPQLPNKKTFNGFKRYNGGSLYEGSCETGPMYLLVCPPAEVPDETAME